MTQDQPISDWVAQALEEQLRAVPRQFLVLATPNTKQPGILREFYAHARVKVRAGKPGLAGG